MLFFVFENIISFHSAVYSVLYLKSHLCRSGQNWTAEIIHMYSQEAVPFIKVFIMHANI